mgnify:CR=1 FL=1
MELLERFWTTFRHLVDDFWITCGTCGALLDDFQITVGPHVLPLLDHLSIGSDHDTPTKTRRSLDRGQNARKNKVTKKLRKSYVRGPGRSYGKRPESYGKVTKKLPPWPEVGPEESKSYPKVSDKL